MKYAKLDLGTVEAIVNKLGGMEGVDRFLRGELVISQAIEKKILKLISAGQSLTLDAVDGSEIIPGSKDMFKAGIDSDFINWGVDEKGLATPETSVEVYEMVEDATFSKMFGSLSADISRLCFTQHQIKNFVKKHKDWLRTDGYGTFFLFKSNENFFVASVSVHSDGKLNVSVIRLVHDYVWYAERRPRVVLPQLAAA